MDKLHQLLLWQDDVPRSGPMNMALDEAMLRAAREPWLRSYGWAVPSVSIGFSQSLEVVPKSHRHWPIVRRWTGGGVVLHDGDWTYTLAIPVSHSAHRGRAPDLYRWIHEAMIAALQACGVRDCVLQPASTSDGMGVCFEEPARFDVVQHGGKVAGAAQRRAGFGLLHQGSVQPLRPPSRFAGLFAAALADKVTVVDQATAEAGLLVAAGELAEEKYGAPEWLHERVTKQRAGAHGPRTRRKSLVFVYGSLKRGCCNEHFLDGQRFVAAARTRPGYRLADLGGYPGMYPVARDGLAVRGEVWEVDETCRARLDELEDVAHGVYSFDDVKLEAPFDSQAVKTYLYRMDIAGRPDAGDDWHE